MNLLSKHKYILLVANIINGKKLPDVIYIYKSVSKAESNKLRNFISSTISFMGLVSHPWNILKLFKKVFKAFLLHYLNFFSSSYPALQISIILIFIDMKYKKLKYDFSDNPPILRRKDKILLPDYPMAPFFQELTRERETAGLYKSSKFIGCKKKWRELIGKVVQTQWIWPVQRRNGNVVAR